MIQSSKQIKIRKKKYLINLSNQIKENNIAILKFSEEFTLEIWSPSGIIENRNFIKQY